jgi:hypothetical protein
VNQTGTIIDISAAKLPECSSDQVLADCTDRIHGATPAERGRIEVEDAPFVAVELDWTGDGRHQVLSFRTNIDEVVTAGPEHPIRVSHDLITCEPTPYLLVRPGAAGHLAVEARINRATYYELVALAVPEWVGNKRLLGVWSQGKFFSLGEMPPGGA